jgi:hypothetical protein
MKLNILFSLSLFLFSFSFCEKKKDPIVEKISKITNNNGSGFKPENGPIDKKEIPKITNNNGSGLKPENGPIDKKEIPKITNNNGSGLKPENGPIIEKTSKITNLKSKTQAACQGAMNALKGNRKTAAVVGIATVFICGLIYFKEKFKVVYQKTLNKNISDKN